MKRIARATSKLVGIVAVAVLLVGSLAPHVGATTPEDIVDAVEDVAGSTVEIVQETADGSTVISFPAEPEDIEEYSHTEEFASSPPPGYYLWSMDGSNTVTLASLGSITGTAWTSGWYSGSQLKCSGWFGYLTVTGSIKAEGQHVDDGAVPPITPVSTTSSTTTRTGTTCYTRYKTPNAVKSVPYTSGVSADYIPSTWTSTHTFRLTGMKWTSPKGKVIRYKGGSVLRECVTEMPSTAVADQPIGAFYCNTRVNDIDGAPPVHT